MNTTRSSSSWSNASCAQTRWARCGGLNVPPRRPSRAKLGADLAVAVDQIASRAQLAQADRPARVQLLRRVADLGAHAELAAVGEARRRVDVDAGRVDAELERPSGIAIARDDRLRMARRVTPDVLDRLLEGVDHADREIQGQVLVRPVGLAGDVHVGEQRSRLLVAVQPDSR